MKRIALILAAAALSGCFDDVSDVQQYMTKVKATTPVGIEPMLEIKEFEHLSYKTLTTRSPFVAPKPEAVQEQLSQVQDCLAPDPRRRKQPLEKFALDNLTMKGTIGETSTLWGLIEASDSSLHRVSVGDYVGLFHGKVTRVSDVQIELTELIPDGTGCWKERFTVVEMIEPETNSGRN